MTTDRNVPRVIQMQQISPQWLFNRLQTQGGLTLVDTRGFKCYEHSHIWSFINLPQPLRSPLSPNLLDDIGLSNIDDGGVLNNHGKRLWSKRRLTVAILYDHFGMYQPSSWAIQLALLLLHEGSVTCVKLLQGGMQAFQREYPFMITRRKDSAVPQSTPVKTTVVIDSLPRSDRASLAQTHTLTFPNDIIPGFLYLGNVWQASQPEILRKMGITHVLSVCETPLPTQLKRISYMHIPSRDHHNLNEYFNEAYTFMKKAKKSGGKVLVNCVSGVSASPTLAVYYLMRADRISLVHAYNDVHENRPLMFPSMSCIQMLVESELYRYGSSSIRDANDISQLQNGEFTNMNPITSQLKLSIQLSMFFRGRCNERYVQSSMQQIFGEYPCCAR